MVSKDIVTHMQRLNCISHKRLKSTPSKVKTEMRLKLSSVDLRFNDKLYPNIVTRKITPSKLI